MQRVRLALPFLRAHGWEPTVLSLRPEMVEGAVLDPLLERTYPSDIQVVRAGGIPPRLTRWAGFGNIWWRCGSAFRRAGEAMLTQQRFDLAFISTTQVGAFQLGPRWRRQFGLPYVLDYQDPFRNPYYARTGTRPPGGWLKFALSEWVARRIEPQALRHASGVIAVSASYGAELARSYPWFDPARAELVPFGASEADFTALADYRPTNPLVPFGDGCFHHVYAGRCGPDMSFSLTALFRAFKRYLHSHPEVARRIRFHFIGTDYAPPPLGRLWARPIADAEGLSEYVHEHCYRVPYFDALYYLAHADALIGVGSNDPGYAASKIFPYVLARRPLLLIYHQNSLVLDFARQVAAGQRFSFSGPEDIDDVSASVYSDWFAGGSRHQYRPFDGTAFRPFTAEVLAARLAGVFERATQATDQ